MSTLNANDFPIIRPEAMAKLAKTDVVGVLRNVTDGEPTSAGTSTLLVESIHIGKSDFHRESVVLFSQADQDAAKAAKAASTGKVRKGKASKASKLSASL